MKPDYSLYLVTGKEILRSSQLDHFLQQVIRGGVSMVQLREKELGTRDFFQLALRIQSILKAYDIPLIINDHLDVAMGIGADGVHLGQSDFPFTLARKMLGPKPILGISIADENEVATVPPEGVDYVGVGPVFATATKKEAAPCGLKNLLRVRKLISLPLVAIGGINSSNLDLVLETGVEGVAVVSALCEAGNPLQAAQGLRMKIDDHNQGRRHETRS